MSNEETKLEVQQPEVSIELPSLKLLFCDFNTLQECRFVSAPAKLFLVECFNDFSLQAPSEDIANDLKQALSEAISEVLYAQEAEKQKPSAEQDKNLLSLFFHSVKQEEESESNIKRKTAPVGAKMRTKEVEIAKRIQNKNASEREGHGAAIRMKARTSEAESKVNVKAATTGTRMKTRTA